MPQPRSAYECRTAAELARWAAEEIRDGVSISEVLQTTIFGHRACMEAQFQLAEWLATYVTCASYYTTRNSNARRLALLLAAEMLEDEDAR